MEKEENIFQSLKERLTEHGVKATSQRMVIYHALLQSADHPSAEKLYDRIRHAHPSISLATVYKTMDTLVEAGLARKVKTVDDVLHFDAKTEQHSHLYCTRTSRILDFEDEELHKLLEDYFAKKNISNFRVTDFQVQINGELLSDEKTGHSKKTLNK